MEHHYEKWTRKLGTNRFQFIVTTTKNNNSQTTLIVANTRGEFSGYAIIHKNTIQDNLKAEILTERSAFDLGIFFYTFLLDKCAHI